MPGSKSEHRLFYMSGPSKPVLAKNVLDEICQVFILCPNPYMNPGGLLCFIKCLLDWQNGSIGKLHKCEDLSLDLENHRKYRVSDHSDPTVR